MSWSYRAMKGEDEGYYVHEVYMDKGAVSAYTSEIKPYGESLEELIENLEMMLNDLKTHGEHKDESNGN